MLLRIYVFHDCGMQIALSLSMSLETYYRSPSTVTVQRCRVMDLSTCQASVILRGLPLHNFSIGRYELQEAMIISRLCHSLIEDSDTYI